MYGIKKGETNTKLVKKYMDNGHPLNQAFLIQALTEHAQNVVEQKEQLLKQENTIVSMEAWVKCAEDWLKCYNDRR